VLETLFVVAVMALFLWVAWQVFAIVGEMAEDRRHNPWPWWLLSLAWSPFAVMFILWLFFPVNVSN